MLTIWKYEIKDSRPEIEMPKGAKILAAQWQGDSPVMWASVDTAAPKTARKFRWCATGGDIKSDVAISLTYIATLQWESGVVYHLFEEIEGLTTAGADNLYTMLSEGTLPQWILTKDRPHPLGKPFAAWHNETPNYRATFSDTPMPEVIGWLPLPQQGPSDE